MPGRETTRRTYLKMAGCTVAVGSLAGCTGDDGDGETIRIADWKPESHHARVDFEEPWTERASELSDGALEFELLPPGELGGATEMVSLLRDGAVDMGNVGIPYFPGELPVGQVTNLAGKFLDTSVAMTAFQDLLQGYLHEEELEPLGIQPLAGHIEPPYNMGTITDDPVTTLEDWGGLTVRSGGGVLTLNIEALGGSTAEIEATEVYTALERGTIDANVGTASAQFDFDLQEHYTYFTSSETVNLGSFNTVWAMNQDEFDDLSSEAQDALLTAAEEVAPEAGATFDEQVATAEEDLEDAGIEVYDVPDADYAEWEEAFAEAEETWAEDVEGGDAAIDAWESALEDAQ